MTMGRIRWRWPRSWREVKMSRFMLTLTLLGLIAIPILWIQTLYTWAIVVLLTVMTMVVQAACIDMPGTPDYDELEREWHPPKTPHR